MGGGKAVLFRGGGNVRAELVKGGEKSEFLSQRGGFGKRGGGGNETVGQYCERGRKAASGLISMKEKPSFEKGKSYLGGGLARGGNSIKGEEEEKGRSLARENALRGERMRNSFLHSRKTFASARGRGED